MSTEATITLVAQLVAIIFGFGISFAWLHDVRGEVKHIRTRLHDLTNLIAAIPDFDRRIERLERILNHKDHDL